MCSQWYHFGTTMTDLDKPSYDALSVWRHQRHRRRFGVTSDINRVVSNWYWIVKNVTKSKMGVQRDHGQVIHALDDLKRNP